MSALQELTAIKEQLEDSIRVAQSELESVKCSIEILQRTRSTTDGHGRPGRDDGARTSIAQLGVTDAIRRVLAPELMTPKTVRDAMLSRGFPTDSPSKLLNTVYATLSRFAETGEAERGQIDGKNAFQRGKNYVS
jgi:hypothetical protein